MKPKSKIRNSQVTFTMTRRDMSKLRRTAFRAKQTKSSYVLDALRTRMDIDGA